MPKRIRNQRKHSYVPGDTKACEECRKTMVLGDSPGALSTWHYKRFCNPKCQRTARDRKKGPEINEAKRKRRAEAKKRVPLGIAEKPVIKEGDPVTLRKELWRSIRKHPEFGELLADRLSGTSIDMAFGMYRNSIK